MRSLYARLICNSQGLQGEQFPKIKREVYSVNWGNPEEWTPYETAFLNAIQAGLSVFETQPRLSEEEIEDSVNGIDRVMDCVYDLQCKANKTRLSIPELWVLKRLGRQYRDLATEITHDAFILWVELQGKTHPLLCLKRTMLDRIKREGIAQKIFTPLTVDVSMRLGRNETGVRLEDLPDNLQAVAHLRHSGFTTAEIASKLRKSPRDVCNAFREIGEFLTVNRKRQAVSTKLEFDQDVISSQTGEQVFRKMKRISRKEATIATMEQWQAEQSIRQSRWNDLHGPIIDNGKRIL